MATKQNSNRPYKGLYTDSSPVDQPKGTYTMAWNAINETTEGDNNFISNEQSNELCGQLPEGYTPIGDVYIGDNSTFVFSTDGTNSEMGIIDEKCTYTSIVNNTCLGFSIEHQIDAIFRVRKGCERTVYFTDGINSVRYFNIDKPEDFKDELDQWDCNLFKLFLDFKPPCFSSFEVNELGFLESGTYAFALQYLDNDNNPTKWSYISQPVPIFKSQLNLSYYDITGSSNLESDSQGGTGATNKGIEVTLTNLDQKYLFYRFAVIHYTNFSGLPTIAYQSAVRSTELNNFFYGGATDEFTQIDVAEITISGDFIETAEHIEQLENRLLLANTKGKQVDFCSFQASASQITSTYVVAPAGAEDIVSGNGKDPNTYWETRGYMGDEVYAFGIVYVFEDGYESPAYHIPGRSKDCLPCTGEDIEINIEAQCIELRAIGFLPPGCTLSYSLTYTYTPDGGSPTTTTTTDTGITTPNTFEVFCTSAEGDTLVIDSFSFTIVGTGCGSDAEIVAGIINKTIQTPVPCTDNYILTGLDTDKITPWNENLSYLYDETTYNALPPAEQLETWRINNTAYPIDSFSGYMAYWESPNSVYPTVLDCDGNDFWGTDKCGNTLAGSPIRHHKFPDRHLVPHVVANNLQDTYVSTLNVYLDFNCPSCNPNRLNNIFTPTDPLELVINYDFEGVAQTPITVDIFKDDFIYDSTTSSYELLEVFIVTKVGQFSVGITNVVASGSVLTTTSGSAQIVTNPSPPTAVIVQTSPKAERELNVLGIKFDNITYPHPDIVGHYIVRGDRDLFNKTVIDKGISNPLQQSETVRDYSLFSYLRGGAKFFPAGDIISFRADSDNFFLSPELLFDRSPANGTYIKRINEFDFKNSQIEGNLRTGEEFDNYTEFGAPAGTSAVFGSGYAVLSAVRKLNYGGLDLTDIRLRPITKSLLMSPLAKNESFIDNRVLYNVSQSNYTQVLDLNVTGTTIEPENPTGSNICYVSVKADRDIHPRTHNCLYDDSVPRNVFGGDTFIGKFDIANTIFYRTQDTFWDDILLIVGIVAAAALSIVTLGAATPVLAGAGTPLLVGVVAAAAVGVTATAISAVIEAMRSEGLEDALRLDNELGSQTSTTKRAMIYGSELTSGIYVESTINTELRQDFVTYSPGNTYWREGDTLDMLGYFRDKLVYYDEGSESRKEAWLHRRVTLPEVYHYNKDFSVFNKLNTYFPLAENYDCCSNCLETFPTRVSYSQQSFQEESSDNYRVFLANNYRDIEAEKGEITNLIRNKNNLLVHTEESLFTLPQNVQERVTNDLISFIGTGSYFSIPPRLVLDDELGSAGSIDKWATVKTENGIFFIDQFNRQVFITGSKGLTPVNTGMRNYFKENLVLFLAEQYYNLTSTEFPNKDNHANPDAIGFHSVYDYRHKRIILTKRDYKILPAYTSTFINVESVAGVITGIVDGQLFFDTTTNKFGIGTGVDTYDYVDLSNVTYFENKSWTLSYSFLTRTWISFHSYIPLYMYSRHNNFVSFIDNDIWKHGVVGNYQNFYGTRYKHVLEYISLSSPIITRIFDEVLLQTIAKSYDTNTEQFIDQRFITFNKAIFYNSTQTTGELTLNVKNQDTENYLINQIENVAGDQITIDRNERNWTINEIRDYRTDYLNSIWTKNWTDLQIEFPIDKTINTSTISFTKNWYELQPMRDKYLIIRFIFDNFDNISLTTNYTFEKENRSFR